MTVQSRDTALQNEVVRLYCRFLKSGAMANPASQPYVEILGSDGATIIDSVPAQFEYDGIWYVDWFVPKDLPVGTYYDRWTFQWSDTSSVEELVMPIQVRSFDNYINFISSGISHNYTSRVMQLLKDLENFFIYEATHIPIYWEQGMRIQQEDQDKRTKTYYHITLDGSESYTASKGDVYFNNGNKFTVFESFDASLVYSSSSSTSSSTESSGEESESSEILLSTQSSDSSESSSSTEAHFSSRTSSSESEENYSSASTQTEEPVLGKVVTFVGTGNPHNGGTLVKVSGEGSDTIKFISYSSKRSKFSSIYSFVFRNWVKDYKPIVRINQRIVDDGWYADYDGKIYIDRLMSPEDTVEVSYKFSCFSEEQLLGFLRMGLMMMNAVPPSSEVYGQLDQMPYEWNAPVLLYAGIQSLRRALFGLNFQEKRSIYGGAGNDEWANNTASILQNLYQDYNTQFNEIKKDVKSKKLPGIAVYVTPEYTLPGGRSRWFRYLYKGGAS